MPRKANPPDWVPLPATDRPLYLAIADAIQADVAAGTLGPGRRLPPHRRLAEALGVDLTTVTRAYSEARRRGLVDATVGRGTYVREGAGAPPATAGGADVDLSMNLPPQPPGLRLGDRLADACAAVLRQPGAQPLLSYQPAGGSPRDRAAGAAWLAPLLPGVATGRVLVSGGAQPALAALLPLLARAGETVVTEQWCYPGLRAAAGQAGVTLHGLAMDGDGLLPEALDEACRRLAPKALCCGPTIHNPTTATMPPARRAAIAEVLQRHRLPVIEDDAYGLLPDLPLPPLAALVPELAWYVATTSKCLMPGLRVAHVVAPDTAAAARGQAALRAVAQMATPLTVAVATRWIENGSATAIRDAVRAEARARQDLARALLPAGHFAAHPDGYHVWMQLPADWPAPVLAGHLRQAGLAVVPDEAFAAGKVSGRAIRLSLGAARDRAALATALTRIAGTLAQGAAEPAIV